VTTATTLAPARLRPADLARVASVGLRTRRLRAALSALGIAIGVAAIVAVLGLSQSSSNGRGGFASRARHWAASSAIRQIRRKPSVAGPAIAADLTAIGTRT
jgi:hypothetical protein